MPESIPWAPERALEGPKGQEVRVLIIHDVLIGSHELLRINVATAGLFFGHYSSNYELMRCRFLEFILSFKGICLSFGF